jgi:leucyl aminopeptidase
MSYGLVEMNDAVRMIHPVTKAGFGRWLKGRSEGERAWIAAHDYAAAPGSLLALPNAEGALPLFLLGVEAGDDAAARLWAYSDLPYKLPPGTYRIDSPLNKAAATQAALGWALGTYRFDRYRQKKTLKTALVWPENADRADVLRAAEATHLARDLINTPAEDLGPAELLAAAQSLAKRYGAVVTAIVGDELLTQNWPAVHAVGRASAKPPMVIDLRWGDPSHPKVTLVGKGVCFDSGGYDLKTSAGMKLMKKDMGGAATVIALAGMVMDAKLPVRLRLLTPAVENMVAGNAFRPLDVLNTRKGTTVEVGNTDAEGRLILCDALTEADAEKPALLLDVATLTGAARVALGPELPALFTRHDDLADSIGRLGAAQDDPFWRLPLWPGYRRMLDSKVADLSSTGDDGFAGAVTAAIFLSEFVSPKTRWAHIDTMAWSPRARPGRPEGGEPLGLRALFALVKEVAKG